MRFKNDGTTVNGGFHSFDDVAAASLQVGALLG
jgi:hypothetical protein